MRKIGFIALLLSAGCVDHYAVPRSSPTATVIFSTDADGVMVQAFADRTCGKSMIGTRVAYFFRDHFDQRSGAAKEVVAGRDFVFTFRSRSDTGTVATFCKVTRSFVPEASQTYRAHFISAPDRCDVEVTRSSSHASDLKEDSAVDVAIVDPVCFNDLNG